MIKKRLAVEGGHYDKWPKTVLEGGNFSFITNMLNTLAHKTNGISHASINKLKDSFNKAHKTLRI